MLVVDDHIPDEADGPFKRPRWPLLEAAEAVEAAEGIIVVVIRKKLFLLAIIPHHRAKNTWKIQRILCQVGISVITSYYTMNNFFLKVGATKKAKINIGLHLHTILAR